MEPHSFVAILETTGWVELGRGPDGRRTRSRLERPFVTPRGRISGALKWLVGQALRWLARGIYLVPLWVVAAVVAGVIQDGAAAWVTAAFVTWLVAFFATLNLFILVAAARYLLTRARPLDVARPTALAEPREPAVTPGPGALPAPGALVRLTGELRRLDGPGPEVGAPLVDVWMDTAGGGLRRITEVAYFAVVADDGFGVVLRCASAPTVVGARDEPEAAWAALGPQAQGLHRDVPGAPTGVQHGAILREGDRVEVLGRVTEALHNLDRVGLGGALFAVPQPFSPQGSPYRQGTARPGALVESTATEPAQIRVTGSTRPPVAR